MRLKYTKEYKGVFGKKTSKGYEKILPLPLYPKGVRDTTRIGKDLTTRKRGKKVSYLINPFSLKGFTPNLLPASPLYPKPFTGFGKKVSHLIVKEIPFRLFSSLFVSFRTFSYLFVPFRIFSGYEKGFR